MRRVTRSTMASTILSTSAGDRFPLANALCDPIESRRRPTTIGRGSWLWASACRCRPDAFPNSATIKNWRADGENGLWVQDRKGDWYYGKFAVICRNADFALAIGIDNRGTSTLDRFATVIVGRERCPLISFVSSAPPPTKAELKAKREAEKAAKSN